MLSDALQCCLGPFFPVLLPFLLNSFWGWRWRSNSVRFRAQLCWEMSNNGLWCGERCREAQICGICCFHGCGNSYHDLYSKLLTSASSQNSWKSNGGCHHDRRRVSLPWENFWVLIFVSVVFLVGISLMCNKDLYDWHVSEYLILFFK